MIMDLAHISKKTSVDHDTIHGVCKHTKDECHDLANVFLPLEFTCDMQQVILSKRKGKDRGMIISYYLVGLYMLKQSIV
jgi:hypothetical protein